MSEKSRRDKSIKNLLFGTGAQIIQTLFPFITRTVFIHTLGVAYLGVGSLFTNILTVLSLAELGLGNVVVYSLYKPLAEKDTDKVVALVSFYKTVYTAIAAAVFTLGVLLLPFLEFIVNLPDGFRDLRLIYMLYVFHSALSYLFVYKSSVINADQKQYIVSSYRTIALVLQNIVQAVILLVTNNFILYLIIQIVTTLALNLSLSKKADRLYHLKNRNCKKLTNLEKKSILLDTKAMFAYRIGGTFLNSTDSVFISTMISTVTVGLYANYLTVESLLNKFVSLIYDAIYASVGNLNATASKTKSKEVFNVLTFCFIWIGTVGFVGYYTVADSVISLWIGEQYCIDSISVLALAVRFYMPIILYPVWMYRNTTGLFKETQNILIYAGVLNLVFSYLLGKAMGLAGILFATSLARAVTSFWYEPYVLYKKKFSDDTVTEYFSKIFLSLVIAGASVFVVKAVMRFLDNTLLDFIIGSVLSFAIPSLLLVLCYSGSNELKYVRDQISGSLKKRRKRA